MSAKPAAAPNWPPFAFTLDPAALAAALTELADDDAVSLPLLSPADCRPLTAAAKALPYRRATPVIGSGDKEVRQDFDLTVELDTRWIRPKDEPALTIGIGIKDHLKAIRFI